MANIQEHGEDIYRKIKTVNIEQTEVMNSIYSKGELTFTELSELENFNYTPIANEYFIFKCDQQSALIRYYAQTNSFKLLPTYENVSGINPKNTGQKFALDALLDPSIELVTITGEAGSGKTLLTLAAAVFQKRNYLQIHMAKPVVPVGNDIGFLPGTIEEKLHPYMASFYDNLSVIKHYNKKVESLLEKDKIQIAPIAYIRGRSLPRIFFIYDETQSTTKSEIKSVITRAGEGTKVVCLGDLTQIDAPNLNAKNNGLAHVISRMSGEYYYAHIHLDKSERSRLAERASKLL